MRASEIVRRLIGSCQEGMHAVRYRAVEAAVVAMVEGQHATLTSIGRSLASESSPRHGIKRMDRLLGNSHVFRERNAIFRALARQLLGNVSRVPVLVDWTALSDDRLYALVGSVPFLGRSLPILAHVHAKKKLGSSAAHEDFLDALLELLPAGCRPVIIADGGFRSTFFNACRERGIQFVVRLRADACVVDFDLTRRRARFAQIFASASGEARCLGEARPFATSPEASTWRLVLGPRPAKAGRRVRYANDYERRRACEPFFLATNLENESAQSIVALYASRMKIEETFRDAKCPRFGWALEHSKTRSSRRFSVLLAIVCIAQAAVALLGAAAERAGLEPKFRASSRRSRVLSCVKLGAIIARWPARPFAVHLDVSSTLGALRDALSVYFPPFALPRSRGRVVPPPLPHGLFCVDCGWQGRRFGWPR